MMISLKIRKGYTMTQIRQIKSHLMVPTEYVTDVAHNNTIVRVLIRMTGIP